METRPSLPPGASLCGIIGFGVPMSVDFIGPHTFSDVGPIVGVLAVLGAATVWLFRRYGGDDGRETLAPEVSEAMWAELEEFDDHAGPREDDEQPAPVTADGTADA